MEEEAKRVFEDFLPFALTSIQNGEHTVEFKDAQSVYIPQLLEAYIKSQANGCEHGIDEQVSVEGEGEVQDLFKNEPK